MAAIKGRARRTRGVEHDRMHVTLPPAIKRKAQMTAAALGISTGAYIEALIAHEALDEQGRPAWWTAAVPSDQEELPLKRSA